jgi:translation elongation factor EF-1alpha
MVFGFFKKSKGTKKSSKKKATKRVKPKTSKQIIVGDVIHYFPKVKAAVIKVKKGPICVNDILYFKGHTTSFKQKISSMQIDHKPIQKATKGKEIGIRVKKRVRITDKVYKDK